MNQQVHYIIYDAVVFGIYSFYVITITRNKKPAYVLIRIQ